MKRKIMSALLIASMVVGLAACGNTGGNNGGTATGDNNASAGAENSASGDVETRSFLVAGGYGETHGYNADAQAALDLLVECSGGKYSYNLYNGGSLVKFLHEYDGLKDGTSQMSISLDPLVDTHTPYSEVFMLPIISGDAVQLTKAAQAVYESDVGRTYYEHDFLDNGIKAFPYSACTPYVLSFSSKYKDVKSASDISSTTRIRSTTRTNSMFLESLGVTPVTLNMDEIYDAYSKGSVDGMVGCAAWESSYGIGEFAGETIGDAPLGTYVSVFSMTTDTWDSLDESVKKAFEEKWDDTMLSIVENGEGWEKVFKENWDSVLSKNATKVSLKDMDQDFQDLYDKACGETWLKWVDSLNEQGLNGTGMAILWRDAMIEQGCEVPTAAMELKQE